MVNLRVVVREVERDIEMLFLNSPSKLKTSIMSFCHRQMPVILGSESKEHVLFLKFDRKWNHYATSNEREKQMCSLGVKLAQSP